MSDTIALLPDGTQHPADGFGGTAANRFDDAVPGALLRYTHLSSVSALADVPEHYSVIAFALDAVEGGTSVRLMAERFATETIYRHLDLYWRGTMEVFKAFVERRPIMNP